MLIDVSLLGHTAIATDDTHRVLPIAEGQFPKANYALRKGDALVRASASLDVRSQRVIGKGLTRIIFAKLWSGLRKTRDVKAPCKATAGNW